MLASGEWVIWLFVGFLVLAFIGGVMQIVNRDKAATAIRKMEKRTRDKPPHRYRREH